MADVPAVLFDMDGTLVDSNYLHVYAWTRAFQEAGIAVESWRIHRSIGMDGDRLIQSLSGDADDDAQKQAEELHTRYLKEAAPLLRPLPGARELLKRVSLARSAGRAGQLGERGRVGACRAKSSTATTWCRPRRRRRMSTSPSRTRRSSRSRWTGRASTPITPSMSATRCGTSSHARRAGVPAIGLLSGGVSREELEKAGAEAVFDNPRDLCDHIDSTR